MEEQHREALEELAAQHQQQVEQERRRAGDALQQQPEAHRRRVEALAVEHEQQVGLPAGTGGQWQWWPPDLLCAAAFLLFLLLRSPAAFAACIGVLARAWCCTF